MLFRSPLLNVADQSMVSLLCYVSGQLSHLSPNVIDVQRGQIILDLLKTIIGKN
jgi:hypothetical protein